MKSLTHIPVATFSLFSLVSLLVLGCGDSVIPAGSVARGVVKCEAAGAMIEGGLLTFVPVGEGSSAFAEIGPDGAFTVATSPGVSGLAPGEYHVAVEIELDDIEDAEGNVIPCENPIPEKFWSPETSGLTVTATEGDNDWTIDLDASDSSE